MGARGEDMVSWREDDCMGGVAGGVQAEGQELHWTDVLDAYDDACISIMIHYGCHGDVFIGMGKQWKRQRPSGLQEPPITRC